MLDYDVSRLEDFSLGSMNDLFAVMAQCSSSINHVSIKSEKPESGKFEYESDYLEYGDFNPILELFKKRYLKDYYEKKTSYKRRGETKDFNKMFLPLVSVIADNYNALLTEKQRFVKVEDYSKEYLFDIAANGSSEEEKFENFKRAQEMIKDPDFTFNHCIYYKDSLISTMSLYRRLRVGKNKVTVSQIMLLISAFGLPLRLNLSFPKGSVREKKYGPIFQTIPNIVDQLNCYFCMEHINLSKWLRKFASKNKDTMYKKNSDNHKLYEQIYRRYIENGLYYTDILNFVEMFGASIKISFTPETIQKYQCYQEVKQMLALYSHDKTSEEIGSNVLESIDDFDVLVAECLLKLDEERKNNVNKKEADS